MGSPLLRYGGGEPSKLFGCGRLGEDALFDLGDDAGERRSRCRELPQRMSWKRVKSLPEPRVAPSGLSESVRRASSGSHAVVGGPAPPSSMRNALVLCGVGMALTFDAGGSVRQDLESRGSDLASAAGAAAVGAGIQPIQGCGDLFDDHTVRRHGLVGDRVDARQRARSEFGE